jgi:SAM-dependent methyltransferase
VALASLRCTGPSCLALTSRVRQSAGLAWRLLDLRAGLSVLDLACGHGKLANGLAARGCRVTGLDSSAVFPLTADHRRMIIIADLPSDLPGTAQPPAAAGRPS